MLKKDMVLRVPQEMFDKLNEIAKRECRPRSWVIREMLERGIEQKRLNHLVSEVVKTAHTE